MAGSVKINHLLWLSLLNVAGLYSDSSGANKRMFWSAVFRLLCTVIIQVKKCTLSAETGAHTTNHMYSVCLVTVIRISFSRNTWSGNHHKTCVMTRNTIQTDNVNKLINCDTHYKNKLRDHLILQRLTHR